MRYLLLLIVPILLFANQDRAIYIKKYKNESKTALVIGNNNYKHFSKLKNSKNDARDMKRVLNKLGFNVIYLENGNLRDMKKSVRKFTKKLRNGGVGFFYYAGHGVEVDGENFLIPYDAQIPEKNEVEYESLPVNMVVDKMEDSNNRLNIVVLDACRNDPFSRSGGGGLAQINNARGMYIAYATAPGQVASDGSGKNGLFTKHLISNISKPNLKLNDVFAKTRAGVYEDSYNKQLPWTSSSVIGDFYFNIDTDIKYVPKKTAKPKSKKSSAELSDEDSFWQIVLEEGTVDYYKMYLQQYPNGKHKVEAELEIQAYNSKKALEKKARMEKLAKQRWDRIKNSKYKDDFQKFIKQNPKSKYIPIAKLKLKKAIDRPKRSSKIIIDDNFSTNRNNWATEDHEKARLQVKNGRYEFEHKRDNRSWSVWKTLPKVKGDFELTVDTYHKSGVDNYSYGLIFGGKDVQNIYWFNVSGNGYYRVGKFENNKWNSLIAWKQDPLVKKYGKNKLKIKRIGSKVKFYVNNNYIGSITAKKLFGNKYGFHVENKQTAQFDNFKIKLL